MKKVVSWTLAICFLLEGSLSFSDPNNMVSPAQELEKTEVKSFIHNFCELANSLYEPDPKSRQANAEGLLKYTQGGKFTFISVDDCSADTPVSVDLKALSDVNCIKNLCVELFQTCSKFEEGGADEISQVGSNRISYSVKVSALNFILEKNGRSLYMREVRGISVGGGDCPGD